MPVVTNLVLVFTALPLCFMTSILPSKFENCRGKLRDLPVVFLKSCMEIFFEVFNVQAKLTLKIFQIYWREFRGTFTVTAVGSN